MWIWVTRSFSPLHFQFPYTISVCNDVVRRAMEYRSTILGEMRVRLRSKRPLKIEQQDLLDINTTLAVKQNQGIVERHECKFRMSETASTDSSCGSSPPYI